MAEGFFEFHQRISKSRSAARTSAKTPPPPDQALTVTQFTALIDKALKTAIPTSVAVRGEVSNARRQSAGHLYFTLKDATACLNCVMWREAAAKVKFTLDDGTELIAFGHVAVYAPQGKYQLQVTTLQPVGRGALELAFKQLQTRLAAEGLFDAARKKPLPRFARKIVLVTSKSTAALQDMLKVLRRYPWLKLSLYHVPVQGEGSGDKIAAAISHLNRQADALGGVDVILLARGGGSLEDLWAFNEEILARAIAASRIPIVTGIGHEIDTTIADLVADHHAHTPTEAAQVVVQHWKKAKEDLQYAATRLSRGVRQIYRDSRQRLVAIYRHEAFRRPLDPINQLRQLLDDRQRALLIAAGNTLRIAERRIARSNDRLQTHHPRQQLATHRQRLDAAKQRLTAAMAVWLKSRRAQLQSAEQRLEALSPRQVLRRGYTITTMKKTGVIVRSSNQVSEGDRLLTQFADGQAESLVQDSRQLPLFD
ncbi:MAG: exodeoxyribonuclease VII large subunit [Tepidisphaeraceae bacterium]|jgi:exodeoxyribonuclease VII large subunit